MKTAQSTTKERPIIMSGESVRAILEGRKTQTRRVVKPQPTHLSPVEPYHRPNGEWAWVLAATGMGSGHTVDGFTCPYGAPGDRLWLRETWRFRGKTSRTRPLEPWEHEMRVAYRADGAQRTVEGEHKAPPFHPPAERPSLEYYEYVESYYKRWRSPIHMPKWASRLTLEVTEVRVERLQEISAADAMAEGVDPGCCNCGNPALPDGCGCADPAPLPVDSFIHAWDTLNAKRGHGWETNPWVWVISFRRLNP